MIIKPITVRKLAELQKYLADVPVKARRAATNAAADHLIGELSRYPKYKEVSRKAAYPEVRGWFSARQRRYVMARIRSGRIDPGYPHRTGRLRRGWRKKGEGYKVMIENTTDYAGHVMGQRDQARQPQLAGWRKVLDVANDSASEMRRAADLAIKIELDKKS